MREILFMMKGTEKEYIHGQMEMYTRVIFIRIIDKERYDLCAFVWYAMNPRSAYFCLFISYDFIRVH